MFPFGTSSFMPISLSNVHMHKLKRACKLYIPQFQFYYWLSNSFIIQYLSDSLISSWKRVIPNWNLVGTVIGYLLIRLHAEDTKKKKKTTFFTCMHVTFSYNGQILIYYLREFHTQSSTENSVGHRGGEAVSSPFHCSHHGFMRDSKVKIIYHLQSKGMSIFHKLNKSYI